MTVERIEITSRKQWHALRRKDVTASDIAAVCGVSVYKTIFTLWAEKTGPELGTVKETGAMLRGRWFEKAVFEAAKTSTDWESITPFEDKLYLRDPEIRIGATPDAIGTDSNGEFIVQAKTVSPYAFEQWDGVPLAYELQTLTEAMLYGAKRAYLAILVCDPNKPEFFTHEVRRNAEAEAKIREAVARFWDAIDAGRVPQIDFTRDLDAIKKIFKPRAVPPIDLSGNNMLPAILEERADLKARIKAAGDRVEAIDAELIHALDGAPAATLPGWKITHQTQHRAEKLVPATDFAVLRVARKVEK